MNSAKGHNVSGSCRYTKQKGNWLTLCISIGAGIGTVVGVLVGDVLGSAVDYLNRPR